LLSHEGFYRHRKWSCEKVLALIVLMGRLRRPKLSQVPEAHACNPSYSGDRDKEDWIQSQPRQIVRKTLSRKKPITKKDWWSGSRCRP
jgi:hypothetical protein